VRKKYRVETNPAAENDIRLIHNEIAADNPQAADRWVKQVERLIAALEAFPRAYEVIPEAQELGVKYRHKLLGNYRIVYRVESDRVIVLRVIHGARLLDRTIFFS
jgi:plasmid stabilization system protein ParE